MIIPGIQTTVQDAGRFGYQWSGISPAGAMDLYSLRLANILVGNEMDEAGLEITVVGPQLVFDCAEVIAITGADLSPTLNGMPIAMNCAISVRVGDMLCFGQKKNGARAYLAFAGGIDIPPLMNSRSTLLRNKLGSMNGNALKKGEEVNLRSPCTALPNQSYRFVEREPIEDQNVTLRVVMGPQDDYFTDEGIRTFLSTKGYRVTKQFSRHGYRLSGDVIQHRKGGDIVSDGIALGAIQIPSDGQPIIMLAERQSTGGYTKIANVISVDIAKISQCIAGARICFQPISIEQAQKMLRDEYKSLCDLEEKMSFLTRCRMHHVRVNGIPYEIGIAAMQ